MQSIPIVKINELNEIIDQCSVNFAPFRVCVYEVNEKQKKYIWLDTIEPYGDTYFNWLQVPYVIQELEQLKKDIYTEDIVKIDAIISFMKDLHTSENIKFIGD